MMCNQKGNEESKFCYLHGYKIMKDNLEWSRAEFFYSKDPLNGEKDKRIESLSKLLASLPNVELSS